MTIRIVHGDVHLIDLATRLPFKYGIATMTRAPQAFVRLFVEIDGQEAIGIAADVLPPKWFTKIAAKPLDAEIGEMLKVIRHAVSCARAVNGETVFAVWQAIYAQQQQWGREEGLPTLLSQFGTTLVERALIEAFCRAQEKPFAQCLRNNDFGMQLEAFDGRLAGRVPGELLPAEAKRRIVARHTVGMADPLEDSDIEAGGLLNDGLPQSLVECIRRYGLKHFKLKVAGNIDQDVQRLSRIAVILGNQVAGEFAFTLDGNESFRSLAGFREYWEQLTSVTALSAFLRRLMFVEQPFHREVALDAEVLRELNVWQERPRLIIDESDAELGSLPLALALGYHGTSHKNCKGVFKGVANACLLEVLRRQPGGGALVMSGEDLANIGPVALLQDLAVVASLGIRSVERNGHHYFAGLSAFPDEVQRQMLQRHSDLYEQIPSGWASLRIAQGELALDSVVAAPLGVGFELDVTQFTPAEQWQNSY